MGLSRRPCPPDDCPGCDRFHAGIKLRCRYEDVRDVLVVEDILDSGLTLRYIVDNLKLRSPRSLKVVALMDKPDRRRIDIEADYVGFKIPNKFVVGYGVDFAERFRNLPYVGYIEEPTAKGADPET
jgi:hypoxanthine phosphoribosyltransferase